jgi:hypothetical protein
MTFRKNTPFVSLSMTLRCNNNGSSFILFDTWSRSDSGEIFHIKISKNPSTNSLEGYYQACHFSLIIEEYCIAVRIIEHMRDI